MPLVRNIGNGVWKVRSSIPNGIARMIFTVKNKEMFLLHGFIKKTQKSLIKN
ncbi:type II toxin-antitoxin system RelE/ParE family toxin [Candidatus Protochlamydia amoebophila]|uniref:type II toxin-antitoxin system RelE/ParE family toxin n=1 Tax=Candidatus Protochlamydia amoebophila TaxID=362787 RepID=UPI001BC9D50A